MFLNNSDGTLVTEQHNILKKWKEYFWQLLNCDNPIDMFTWINIEPNKSEYPPLFRVEIIQQLKNYKSLGVDGI